MTTVEIANKLVALCSAGNWQQVHDELYHADAESIEPDGTTWGNVKGMEAIANKGKQWQGMIEEYHGNTVSEPLVAGNFFTVRMVSNTTMKGMGRMQFEELCMYEVKDGKIIKEQFFYTPPDQG
jgi:hypothetical protein